MPQATLHLAAIGFTVFAIIVIPVTTTAQGTTSTASAIYASQCLACHGADGTGPMPGMPDFTDPSGVLAKSDEVLLRSLIEGVQRPGASVAMPPLGGNPVLTPADMRTVLTYLRREFAPPVPRSTGAK